MANDNFLFFFDIFFSGTIINITTNYVGKRNKKFRFLGFIVGALILLSIHIYVYFSKKNLNYFQIMEVPRVFDLPSLKSQYKAIRKSKKYYNSTIRLEKVYEILSNPPLKNGYDKFMKTSFSKNEEMVSYVHNFSMMAYHKVFESLVYYIVMIVIVTITSDDDNSKHARKWLVATMVGFYFIELNYIFLNNNERDFFDLFLPTFAIFERIELFRELLMPLLFIIKYRYQLFYKDEFFNVIKQVKKELIIQRGINAALENIEGIKKEDFAGSEKNLENTMEFLKIHFIDKKKEENKKKIEEEKREEKLKNNDKKTIKDEKKRRVSKKIKIIYILKFILK